MLNRITMSLKDKQPEVPQSMFSLDPKTNLYIKTERYVTWPGGARVAVKEKK